MMIIEAHVPQGSIDTVARIVAEHQVIDQWTGCINEDGRQSISMLITADKTQKILDALQQQITTTGDDMRIVLMPVEATVPRIDKELQKKDTGPSSKTTSREELYHDIESGAQLDTNFLVLVTLSTVVAAIGLLKDNVAVVIGAMVIAPLLGPNLALALGAALGDKALIAQSTKTNVAGIGLAIAMSVLIGMLLPLNVDSHELLSRTEVGLDSVALALASGAAAVLSITTGLSSVLVGVMVAVALLPPSATLGLMMGAGLFDQAAGAGLLLAVNVVCVNLAAKVVFLIKGVRPRTWHEQKQARQSMAIYIGIWLVSLLVLVVAILVRLKSD